MAWRWYWVTGIRRCSHSLNNMLSGFGITSSRHFTLISAKRKTFAAAVYDGVLPLRWTSGALGVDMLVSHGKSLRRGSTLMMAPLRGVDNSGVCAGAGGIFWLAAQALVFKVMNSGQITNGRGCIVELPADRNTTTVLQLGGEVFSMKRNNG